MNNVPGHRAHGRGLLEMRFRRILRGLDRPVGRVHAGTPHGVRAIVMRAYHFSLSHKLVDSIGARQVLHKVLALKARIVAAPVVRREVVRCSDLALKSRAQWARRGLGDQIAQRRQ